MLNHIEQTELPPVDVSRLQQLRLHEILQRLCPLQDKQLDKLCSSYALYNAVYDLAEQLYLHGVPVDAEYEVMQILSLGRIVAYQMPSLNIPSCDDEHIQQNTVLSSEMPKIPDDVMDIYSPYPEHYQPNEMVFQEIASSSSLPTDIQFDHLDMASKPVSLQKSDEPSLPMPMPMMDDEKNTMSFFQMSQNARVGLPYQAKIIMQGAMPQAFQIIENSVKFSHDIGLEFDEQHQCVCGQVTQVIDDFYLEFEYKLAQQGQVKSAKVYLTINPNPRDIWQELEPASDLPYAKPHTEHQHMADTLYDIYATRCRGRTHAHTGTYCDDDFFVQTLMDKHWSVLVVSDGAGSAKFSRQGSKLAVDMVGETLVRYLHQSHTELEQLLSKWNIGQSDEQTRVSAHQLYNKFNEQFYHASQRALKCIEMEAEYQQATMRDFASTLLVAVTKHDGEQTFVASFAVGDGAICAYHTEHNVVLMNEPDAGEHAGQTQFLDDIHKTQKQRTHIRYLQGHYHVMLMTDGISDPIFASDAELQSAESWHQFWKKEIVPQLQHEQPSQALLAWSNFYSDGHHDDRTLIVLYAKPLLPTPHLAFGTSLAPQIDTCTTKHHHQE